jgi:hypothetical protein
MAKDTKPQGVQGQTESLKERPSKVIESTGEQKRAGVVDGRKGVPGQWPASILFTLMRIATGG